MNDELSIFPTIESLKSIAKITPEYMQPSVIPQAAMWEGMLSPQHCRRMIETFGKEESYSFPKCNAETRELSRPLSDLLEPIVTFGRAMNDIWWKFDLNDECGAWMQTYRPGNSYHNHTDGCPGQSRKLTVVALLSNKTAYTGGVLRLTPYPEFFDVPKTQGTLCAFPSFIPHEVTPIDDGVRHTINLGFWGPPFR